MTPHLLLAAALAMAGAARAEAPAYAIDPTHTFVNFEVVHFGISTSRGRFDRKEGTVLFDRAARRGRLNVSIDTASVSTGVPALDKQLRSENFLDTARHPSARFVAEGYTFTGNEVSAITGELTLRGKTLPVTLSATRFNCYISPLFKREVCGGDFEAVIERSQWGMGWGIDLGVPDRVKLLIQAEAIRQ